MWSSESPILPLNERRPKKGKKRGRRLCLSWTKNWKPCWSRWKMPIWLTELQSKTSSQLCIALPYWTTWEACSRKSLWNTCSSSIKAVVLSRLGWSPIPTIPFRPFKWSRQYLRSWRLCPLMRKLSKAATLQEPFRSMRVSWTLGTSGLKPVCLLASSREQLICCRGGKSVYTSWAMSMTKRACMSLSRGSSRENSPCWGASMLISWLAMMISSRNHQMVSSSCRKAILTSLRSLQVLCQMTRWARPSLTHLAKHSFYREQRELPGTPSKRSVIWCKCTREQRNEVKPLLNSANAD